MSGSAVRAPVSACIITFNEERNLKAALDSVAFADEIIVVDSGIVHDNAKQGAYNERRAQCDDAARHLGIASLLDATLGDVERLAPQNATLARRVRHVVSENERVHERLPRSRTTTRV